MSRSPYSGTALRKFPSLIYIDWNLVLIQSIDPHIRVKPTQGIDWARECNKFTACLAAPDTTFRGFQLLLECHYLSPYSRLDGQAKAQVFLPDAQGLLSGIADLEV